MDGRAPAAARSRYLPQAREFLPSRRAAALRSGRPNDDGQDWGVSLEDGEKKRSASSFHTAGNRRRKNMKSGLRRLPEIAREASISQSAWRQTCRRRVRSRRRAGRRLRVKPRRRRRGLRAGRWKRAPAGRPISPTPRPRLPPVHGGAGCWRWSAIRRDDGFISGGDDGRLLRIGLAGAGTEMANHKGQVDRPSCGAPGNEVAFADSTARAPSS